MSANSHFFRICTDNARFPDRWFLDEPITELGEELDARDFTYGQNYCGPLPRFVPIQYPGKEVPFNLAAFDMPVVSMEIAALMQNLAGKDIETFPIEIGNTQKKYVILNVVSMVDCLDESKSEIMKWTDDDDCPDRVGQNRMVSNLHVAPSRIEGQNIFRISTWDICLIVSDLLKRELERIGDLGIVFSPVS